MCRAPSQAQRVIRGELKIAARTDRPSTLRDEEYIGVWTDDVQGRGVQCCAVDDGAIVDSIPPEIDEEGGAPSHRATDIADVLLQEERRLLLRVGIPRIPEVVRDIETFGAVVSICSGFRQDLDPSGADLVVFR